ncbi:MAG: hypothetical protein HYX63_21510 [Gammaproteobacteria bacterium]|nr:hypothetical protein [Gammaproteobacteria bacterium]
MRHAVGLVALCDRAFWRAVPWAIAMATSVGSVAVDAASCGSLPASYPVVAGTLSIGSGTVNNGTSTKSISGNGGSNKAIDAASARIVSSSPGFPALVPTTFPGNSSTIDRNAATLPAGSYRTVTVGSTTVFSGGTYNIRTLNVGGGAVQLAPGTYYIDTLIFSNNGTLTVSPSGVVNIFVQTAVGASGSDSVSMNAGGSATNLRFFLYSGASFVLRNNATINGIIYAPNSNDNGNGNSNGGNNGNTTISFNDNAAITGAVISADAVSFGDNLALTHTAVEQAALAGVSTCAGASALAGFSIDIGTATGSTCAAKPITITAVDATGATLANYAGTISISTSTAHGDWSVVTATGALTVGAADSGAARYVYSGSGAGTDNGVVALNLADAHADSVTVTVVDSTGGVTTSTSSAIAFQTNALVVSATDALGTTLVAGRAHRMKAEFWRQDPVSGLCAIATGYSGNKTLDAWVTRVGADPGGSAPSIGGVGLPNAPPGGTGVDNVTLSFATGVTTFSLATSDVGKYVLNLRDDSRIFATGVDITGASASLTTRPFALSLENISASGVANPGASSATGTVFTKAGVNFSAKVRAVLWQSADDPSNSGSPAAGANLADNTTTPSYAWPTLLNVATPFTPATGILGTLNNGSVAQAAFAGGAATVGTLQYTEVGSATLSSSVTNFLSTAGMSVPSSTVVVGRFTPAAFGVAFNTPVFNPGCSGGGFTYLGQPTTYKIAPVLRITALNAFGATARNYTGSFWRMTNSSLAGKTYQALAGALNTVLVPATDPVIVDNGNGMGTLTFSAGSGIAFSRAAPVAPFNAEIALSINVIDADGVIYASNPARFGAATAGNGIAFDDGNATTINDKQLLWGRLRLSSGFGSELLAVTANALVENYTGGGAFVTNPIDQCTTIPLAGIALSSSLATPATGVASIPIKAAATTVAAVANSPLLLGRSGFVFSPPGQGNTGYANLRYDLAVANQTWLQFDWAGTGSYNQDPTARVDFGIYSGSNKVIYTREPW